MEELEENTSESFIDKLKGFKWEDFLDKHKVPLFLALFGLTLIGFGVLYSKYEPGSKSVDIEILESTSEGQTHQLSLFVEVAGAVKEPGVYEMKSDSRVEDALVAAGGFSDDVDRGLVEKLINRAAKLADGQKLYIPSVNQQSDDETANISGGEQSGSSVLGSQGTGLVNINTASQSELESLWGIGPVYAQNIIEHRPYSSVEELLEKKIIKSNVYERNKDLMTVY